MKQFCVFAMTLAALSSCGSKDTAVVKTRDADGTEIVLNKLGTAKREGTPSALALTEEWRLDTGDDEIADFGLTDIGVFDIDSGGNVYFAADRSHDTAVLKFDVSGRPAASFGLRGQGPGDVQLVGALFITAGGDVAVTNEGNNRLTVFGSDGTLLRETPLAPDHIAAAPLPNGSYLTVKRKPDPMPEALFEFPIELAGPDLKALAKLDTGFIENPLTGEQLRGTYHIQSWSVSRDRVFTGHQDRGYDIFVYDFDGRPIRKIRKEYASVPVPEAHKKEFLAQFDAPHFKPIRDKIYFPNQMPPFIGFTADEDGRLYVMTYETANRPGEFIFDIFDPDGALILRQPIRVYQDFNGGYFKVRNGRFYCVEEGGDGQKVFKVSRMGWR